MRIISIGLLFTALVSVVASIGLAPHSTNTQAINSKDSLSLFGHRSIRGSQQAEWVSTVPLREQREVWERKCESERVRTERVSSADIACVLYSAVAYIVPALLLQANNKDYGFIKDQIKTVASGLSRGLKLFAVKALSGSSGSGALHRRQPRLPTSLMTYALFSLVTPRARAERTIMVDFGNQVDPSKKQFCRHDAWRTDPPDSCRQLLGCTATLRHVAVPQVAGGPAKVDEDFGKAVKTVFRDVVLGKENLGHEYYLITDYAVTVVAERPTERDVKVKFTHWRAWKQGDFHTVNRDNYDISCSKTGKSVDCCGD